MCFGGWEEDDHAGSGYGWRMSHSSGFITGIHTAQSLVINHRGGLGVVTDLNQEMSVASQKHRGVHLVNK